MTSPRRIQMHRRKGGWRKDHPDAVIVARPSKWGNPFAIPGPGRSDRLHAIHCFRQWLDGVLTGTNLPLPPATADIIESLRGRDLACWCPLDQPCHADVLLEVANKGEKT